VSLYLSLSAKTSTLNSILNPENQDIPQVGIIMGSDSDLPTMPEAIAVCEEFGVAHEVGIVSAHRTPERMVDYAQNAHLRGLKVIIAGAGGAAHLPGMVASLTPLPVIGVPVSSRHLQGVDSLYSIVQMPRGIPVATVAIGNAQNAGLLAVQILASHQPELLQQVLEYRQTLKQSVLEKQHRLEQLGYSQYLREQIAQGSG
jgi:5-(carboxyamino)imidazole ribonucleotide mutase